MNTLSATAAIQSGWETFKKRPLFFMGIALFMFLVQILLNAIFDSSHQDEAKFFGQVIMFFLNTLVGIGMVAFALKAIESPESATVHDLWHPKQYWEFLGASVLVGIGVVLGLVALIVPGIMLAIMWCFTSYVIVARHKNPIDAMKESARMTKGHRWELLQFFVLAFLVNVLGILCLGVGLLVSAMVTYFAFAHMYRSLERSAGEPTAAQ